MSTPPLRHLAADAKAIVKLANQFAREFEQEYVGTEHILLAILRHDGSVGARVLAHFGVDEPNARAAVEDFVQSAKEDTWVFGRLPGSPNYRRVIELAIEEAAQLESKLIGSEHLLLALLHEKGTTGQRALAKLGVTLKSCRAEILRQLGA